MESLDKLREESRRRNENIPIQRELNGIDSMMTDLVGQGVKGDDKRFQDLVSRRDELRKRLNELK